MHRSSHALLKRYGHHRNSLAAGCWLRTDLVPNDAQRVSPRSAYESSTETAPNLYGLARLPLDAVVPCLNNSGIGRGYMFVQLAINSTALRTIPGVDWDDYGPRLAQWLAQVAELVHHSLPIYSGVIGWEASNSDYEDEGSRREPTRGYLRPDGSGLRIEPPTRFSAP